LTPPPLTCYQAWKEASKEELTTEQAMQKYIDTVEKRWPDFAAGAPTPAAGDGPQTKPAPQGFAPTVSLMQAPKEAAGTEHDLFFYATEGDIAAMVALLQAKADVGEQFDDGATALHVACERGHDEMLSMLLGFHAAGANAEDEDGQTPLHYAIDNNNMGCAVILLQNNADWKVQDSEGLSPLDNAREDQRRALEQYLN